MTLPDDDRVTLLTVKEFAAAWRVTEQTVRAWIRDGKVEAARVVKGGPWRIRVRKADARTDASSPAR